MFQQLKTVVSGAQILFVAFGALVLVPLLTGLNPAMALLGAGVGTLLFQLCTGRQVPIFLGSSFAFIAPIIYATQTWGLPGTMFGLFAAGFMYFVFAALVRWRGIEAVHRLLPPVVIGPVIMIIGLSVATVASNMAMGRAGGNQVMDYQQSLLLAAVSLSATVLVAVFARGMLPGADSGRSDCRLCAGGDDGVGGLCQDRQRALVCRTALYHPGSQLGGGAVYAAGGDCPGH